MNIGKQEQNRTPQQNKTEYTCDILPPPSQKGCPCADNNPTKKGGGSGGGCGAGEGQEPGEGDGGNNQGGYDRGSNQVGTRSKRSRMETHNTARKEAHDGDEDLSVSEETESQGHTAGPEGQGKADGSCI